VTVRCKISASLGWVCISRSITVIVDVMMEILPLQPDVHQSTQTDEAMEFADLFGDIDSAAGIHEISPLTKSFCCCKGLNDLR
jgi:hypothetical protein